MPTDHEVAQYRAISRSAIISAVMAAVSLPLVVLALVSMKFQVGDAVPLGLLGAFFAGVALALGIAGEQTIRRYPTEYTGARLARFGLVSGLLFFVVGSASAAFTYRTEVPDGYSRTGFGELQPDPDEPGPGGTQSSAEGDPHRQPGDRVEPRPRSAAACAGQSPHQGDMGTCCFGGQPKPTDMIEVVVPDGKERVAYSPRRIKLAGTFYLADMPTQSLGLRNVWYHMEVDQVK